jgi:hypothetical protein
MVKSLQTNCPACGGPVEFKVGTSLVTICPYCRSVVARGDKKLEDLGKVADLVQTDSVLEVGRKGRYQGVPFELTGRAQVGHAAGGVWDEWYAHFADGRWGWLAEAQGRYYLTFEQDPAKTPSLPPLDRLPLGKRVPNLGDGRLTVAEKGEARMVSAEGEIPYLLQPGMTYAYADLSGPSAEFATLDYSEETPRLFLGREVTLDDLGLPAGLKPRREEGRRVEALHLNCPNCGGALELRAPDRTERVACPNCGSLLDCNQGQLTLLKALKIVQPKPAVPLGSVGKLHGEEYQVIGYLQRSVTYPPETYYWEEYLLYHPRQGFRWLVQSDRHWSFVEPLPPGKVTASPTAAGYDGKRFKVFQKGPARTEIVLGEFYWKVHAGEMALTRDYIRPPYMLSREKASFTGAEAGTSTEVSWSLGTYLPREEVEKAFGLKKHLPAPSAIAPNQPFPYWNIYTYWAWMCAAALLLGGLVFATHHPQKVYDHQFVLRPPAAAAGGEEPRIQHSEPFELKGFRNIRISAQSSVDNSWVGVEGALVNEETGLVQVFDLPIEYYHGIEDGESWTEGGKESHVYLSALPAGKYTLQLAVSSPDRTAPVTVDVRVEQSVPRFLHWLLALGAVSVIPVCVILYHISFEKRRWENSEFGGSADDE